MLEAGIYVVNDWLAGVWLLDDTDGNEGALEIPPPPAMGLVPKTTKAAAGGAPAGVVEGPE